MLSSDAKKRRRHLRSEWEIPHSRNLATSVSKSAPMPRLSAQSPLTGRFGTCNQRANSQEGE
ncbi:hypothetical protein B5K05_22780 [Rhizobium phaseoli]|nr:hypothetical protein RPHASCH2410_PD03375 [Rhizobium phaseoli Ch24-10]RDJ04895.1 hypothetical protein B5K04_22720 [Rhizobium phaseoli]RDJ07137.1 hypothetical protein B5K05_22780 [Rhizobium phaseoli]